MRPPLIKVMAVSALIVAGLAILSVAARHRSSAGAFSTPTPAPPARPAAGEDVAPGSALQPILDAAPDGATFRLSPGTYAGALEIRRPVTIWGPRSAVIRSDGRGDTIIVRSDRVRLLGFTVDGSGDRPDLADSAVRIHGVDVRVEGLRVINALFGIAAEQSRRVVLVGNEIVGDPAIAVGLRGDGIRLWETRDSLVQRNHLDHSRDVVVWFSPDNRVLDNVVLHSRYGTHMMYSSGGDIERNRYIGNVVSLFIMYSYNMKVCHNLLAANTVEGMGLGSKESGNLVIEGNRFVKNNMGLYLDTSPFRRGDSNLVRGNLFDLCEAAVVFHSSQTRNTFEGNTFRDNQAQVRVEGRGDAMGVTWRGNYFDDYGGYDFDRDGAGDVPYELRLLSNQIIGGRPELAFFRGSPALGLLDMTSQVFPLFRPTPVLVDERPRMAPTVAEGLLP
ncbi:MAG: nitrous oxide reductase family maturation protein NosD [Isosphaeraceae bacterium]